MKYNIKFNCKYASIKLNIFCNKEHNNLTLTSMATYAKMLKYDASYCFSPHNTKCPSIAFSSITPIIIYDLTADDNLNNLGMIQYSKGFRGGQYRATFTCRY